MILAAFGGFAGFFSLFISVLPPFYALFAIVYMIVSWKKYAWFQTFSTSHPQKGESIQFEIHLTNDSFFPLSGGTCCFVVPGREMKLPMPIGFLPGMSPKTTYKTSVECPYRGTYTVGIRSIILSTPLGIIQVEIVIQPQIFYVLPELVVLGQSVEKYMTTAGSMIPGEKTGAGDTSIFEYALPLQAQMSARGILWKKWAATGIPSFAVYGEARSKGISIVIDLYPCSEDSESEEKLAAEDMLMGAAFSVMHYLASRKITVKFFTGGNTDGMVIEDEESFRNLYDRSSNIIFSDQSFPQAAFDTESSAMLFSARPISELYDTYRRNLMTKTEPHLFLCPPESTFEQENSKSRILQDERIKADSRTFFYVADVKKGSGEIANAFH